MKIGQVATRAGVAVDTVRYYEKRGLLPRAPRRRSGYRVFDEDAVTRIRMVKELQALGLNLVEIDALLRAAAVEGARCDGEAPRVREALRRTEEKIAALRSVQRRLRGVLARCEAGTCELVETYRIRTAEGLTR